VRADDKSQSVLQLDVDELRIDKVPRQLVAEKQPNSVPNEAEFQGGAAAGQCAESTLLESLNLAR
jgi:hypothetical protein